MRWITFADDGDALALVLLVDDVQAYGFLEEGWLLVGQH